MLQIHPSWLPFFSSHQNQEYFVNILESVNSHRQLFEIYPPVESIFNVFQLPLSSIKCVILGQDPYHQPQQAMGLAFSVHRHIAIPPSLRNIFKEIQASIPNTFCNHGNLSYWAQQGVFLLNTILTVQKNNPLSHASLGWQTFTSAAIQHINSQLPHLVFMLWGKNAQAFQNSLSTKHTILLAPHPSPLSAHRGFLGCNHFNLCNQALLAHSQTPIDWNVPL